MEGFLNLDKIFDSQIEKINNNLNGFRELYNIVHGDFMVISIDETLRKRLLVLCDEFLSFTQDEKLDYYKQIDKLDDFAIFIRMAMNTFVIYNGLTNPAINYEKEFQSDKKEFLLGMATTGASLLNDQTLAWYATFFNRIEFRVQKTLHAPAACFFNGNRFVIIVNPILMNAFMDYKEQIEVLKHEAMHIIFQHFTRQKDFEHIFKQFVLHNPELNQIVVDRKINLDTLPIGRITNIATDIAINQQLKYVPGHPNYSPEHLFKGVFPETYGFPHELTADEYLVKILEKDKKEIEEWLKSWADTRDLIEELKKEVKEEREKRQAGDNSCDNQSGQGQESDSSCDKQGNNSGNKQGSQNGGKGKTPPGSGKRGREQTDQALDKLKEKLDGKSGVPEDHTEEGSFKEAATMAKKIQDSVMEEHDQYNDHPDAQKDSEHTKRQAREILKKMIENTNSDVERQRGTVPAIINQALELIDKQNAKKVKPPFNVKADRIYSDTIQEEDETKRHPAVPYDINYNGMRDSHEPLITFLIDQSGSMSDDEVKSSAILIKKYAQSKGATLETFPFDVEIGKKIEIGEKTKFIIRERGGGTEVGPALSVITGDKPEHRKKRREIGASPYKPNLIVVLTDGGTESDFNPNLKINKYTPVLFLVINGNRLSLNIGKYPKMDLYSFNTETLDVKKERKDKVAA